nr:iron-only hydrogenase system regulator [bacterium]
MPAQTRIGVVAIVIEDRHQAAPQVNAVLSRHEGLIIGRMGIPYRARGISAIAVVVEGSPDAVGALTGQLGGIAGVTVKAALTPATFEGGVLP